jgi:hypothetical protein
MAGARWPTTWSSRRSSLQHSSRVFVQGMGHGFSECGRSAVCAASGDGFTARIQAVPGKGVQLLPRGEKDEQAVEALVAGI